MRDEPGGRRFFITDLNGPLYVLDKRTKQLTTYLDFNGLGERPGLFRRLTFERNFATGLIDVVFDPDYRAQRRLLHDPHGGSDRRGAGRAACRSAGLDASGYTDDAGGRVAGASRASRITREGVIVEWTDRNIRNTTFEGTARELLRVQLPSPIHPVGDLTFDPTARPRRPRLARHVHRGRRRRHRRAEGHPADDAAAARHAERQDPAHRTRPARAHADEHRQRERALPHPERQPVRRRRGRPQGDLGRRPAQSPPPDLGRRSGPAAVAAPDRVQHRSHRLGDGGDRREGRATTATRCAKARRR